MRTLAIALPLTLALAGCADGPPPPVSAGDLAADSPAEVQSTVAPGAEGLYPGDPLAGPDLDPTDDPL